MGGCLLLRQSAVVKFLDIRTGMNARSPAPVIMRPSVRIGRRRNGIAYLADDIKAECVQSLGLFSVMTANSSRRVNSTVIRKSPAFGADVFRGRLIVRLAREADRIRFQSSIFCPLCQFTF